VAGHRRPHAGPPPGADGVTGAGPKDDAFAALLGIDVERRRPGHTVATLTTTEHHANPHGTVHGAVFYAVVGAALAAAANDEEHSGIVTSVLVEYLRPAAIGDVLRAEVVREVSTAREDIFIGTVHRGEDADPDQVLAWVRARGTRRSRQNEKNLPLPESPSATGMAESVGTMSLTPREGPCSVGACAHAPWWSSGSPDCNRSMRWGP
jgi:acyl-CoA thioesterase